MSLQLTRTVRYPALFINNSVGLILGGIYSYLAKSKFKCQNDRKKLTNGIINYIYYTEYTWTKIKNKYAVNDVKRLICQTFKRKSQMCMYILLLFLNVLLFISAHWNSFSWYFNVLNAISQTKHLSRGIIFVSKRKR